MAAVRKGDRFISQMAEAAARATGGDPLTATMLILFVPIVLQLMRAR